MAKNETFFEYADRGSTSVYKFRFEDDPCHYVWFEYGEDGGSLHVTPNPGPYKVDDVLEDAPHKDLESLLAARETNRAQWIEDLMAQFGERIAWTYP